MIISTVIVAVLVFIGLLEVTGLSGSKDAES